MGTDLETTMRTVREAVEYALECGIATNDVEAALVEVARDVRHGKKLLPETEPASEEDKD